MSAPEFQQIYEVMLKKFPVFAPAWVSARDAFGASWEKDFCENFAKLFGDKLNEKWEKAVLGYAGFCTDALRAQIFFEKNDRYKASNYKEVFDTCYSSYEYMAEKYLPGQYVSHYIWPHHRRMAVNFRSLLKEIGKDVKTFFEVGIGCGFYSQQILQGIPGCRGVGIDVSQHALDFVDGLMAVNGLTDRYQTKKADITNSPELGQVDLVVSQEVLEHLEDPPAFIRALREHTKSGGWGYITAAVNAAHTDHIYLYRSSDEVRAQLESSGWTVKATHVEQAYPEKPEKFRPTIAGFLVKN